MKKHKARNWFSKKGKQLSRFYYNFKSWSIVKHILLFYLFITLIGSLLLFHPISHNNNVSYSDSLFTAASAFSDTGLTINWTEMTCISNWCQWI